jgi:hypothetical protein
MQIQIDIELLIENDISADDYLALYAIYRKGFKTLEQLKINPDWEKLQSKGFVKLGDTPDKHVIRQEFIDLFSSDFDQMFAELVSTYPLKVRTKTGSYRILRGSDPNLKTNAKAKARYSRIVGTKRFMHEKIMRLLRTQLKVERNNLEYMQQLEVWLNNHTWEKYLNIDENGGEETRITRRL